MSSTPTEKKEKRKFEWFWWFVDIIIELIWFCCKVEFIV